MGQVEDVIKEEARKLIRRHQRYLNEVENEVRRIERRSGKRPTKNVLRPSYWSIDRGFDPYYVLSHRHGISYGIEGALRKRDYSPRPAVAYDVPKVGGGQRTVSVFQVADNAVSRVVFKQLMAKNGPRLSGSCYAYRVDLSAHDAILNIASDLRLRDRVYIAEFDFKKYFDSIRHDHIEKILRDERFYVTEREREIIMAFLKTPTVAQSSYHGGPLPRDKGIPQGTSVSLFLANVAATPLDKMLERSGVGFARYADDTLMWSHDYAALCRAVAALEDCGRAMGVEINHAKSPGISLLCRPSARAELPAKAHVEFVGYRVSWHGIAIKDATERKIKRRISAIVYRNLLEEPKRGNIVAERLGSGIDSDYLVMLFQIRRYMYGDLSEKQLAQYLAREMPRMKYKGLMSHYPILSDDDALVAMDGWLVRTVQSAIALRGNLIKARVPGMTLPPPHSLTGKALINLRVSHGSIVRDLRLPSFRRMAKLMRKAATVYGANAVGNALSSYGVQRMDDLGEYFVSI